MEHGVETNIIAVMWALHYGDKGIVLNMRIMNGKTKDKAFDPFFEEMRRQLESYKVVHSRRHVGKFPWSIHTINNSMTTLFEY